MISTFNFLLYWIANYMIFIALTFMLTPRKSKFLSTVIVCAVVFVPTLYKVLHLGEQGQASAVIMIVVTTTLLFVGVKLAFKDSILRCMIAAGLCVFVALMANVIYMLWPNSTDFTTQVYVTQAYLVQITILAMLYPAVIYLWHKFNQRVKIDIRIVIFCVLIYLYFLMIVYIFTYQIYRVDIKSKIVIGVLFFIAVAAVLFIIYILYRKNEEHKKLAAIKELEIARKKESYEYEQLINKIEGMAKIRHDFYDQLSVAKYIGEKDKDKALAMIDELNEKLK